MAHRRLTSYLAVCALIGFTLLALNNRVQAASLTVNVSSDTNDGACTVEDCSLREAIIAANASSDTSTISFEIPGLGVHTIQPTAELPYIMYPVIIDGTTQPDFQVMHTPVIELAGTNAGSSANGLTLVGGNSTVRGLVINRFKSNGILISTQGGNTIVGNTIGTNALGNAALPNGGVGGGPTTGNGIYVNSDAPNNIIGGTTSLDRNLISGNSYQTGITLNSAGNIVQGNYIGTNFTGNSAVGNGYGIRIIVGGGNTIGGMTAGAGNLISGNSIGLSIYSSNNIIQGNRIGTKVNGTDELHNAFIGIDISGDTLEPAANNLVGGTAPGAGNIIAYNGNAGGPGIGMMGTTATVGNSIRGNSIFSNGSLGIDLVPEGVNTDDATDADTGVNDLQNAPTVVWAQWLGGNLRVAASLTTTANRSFAVDIFVSPACDASTRGEGKTYLGSGSITTNASNSGSVIVSFPAGSMAPPQVITATATDLVTGSTSEFSNCALIPLLPQFGPVFTVNTAADVNDGVCGVVECSLREAISAANVDTDLSTIAFQIPGGGVQTIQPTTGLPEITSPVVIDGTTQPEYAVGAPKIELDGTNMTLPSNALSIKAGNSTVKGLVINNFKTGAGIALYEGGNNIVTGCYIGTDYNAGLTSLVGNKTGINIADSSNNTIGGMTPAERNVISDNDTDGIVVEDTPAIGSSSGNTIIGNYIGTDASGTVLLGNLGNGIKINNAVGTIIGGVAAGSGNLISGNYNNGIEITGTSSGTVIQGNTVGVGQGASSTVVIPNAHNGISIVSAANNTIGGLTAAARNVVSGNGDDGISITGGSANNNLVQGNYVGTDATGILDKGNDNAGIRVDSGDFNTVGGTTAGARNLISGNGVGLTMSAGATSNIVQGNYIGTDMTGMVAIPNNNGVILGAGIATDNLVGGTVPGAGNLISGNGNGLLLSINANSNLIQGNIIGANATGTQPLPNTTFGIQVNHGTNNIIGGDVPGAGNIIAFNGTDGVQSLEQIAGDSSTRISGNRIFANGGLGIDLTDNGVTPNDVGDVDTGASQRQNFPVLDSAVQVNGVTTLRVIYNSVPSVAYRFEFFANPVCDASGYGEGQTYLGTQTMATDASGNLSFNANLTAWINAADIVGQYLTMTATDPNNNTSEFSACLRVTIGSAPGAAPVASYYTSPDMTLTWNPVYWAVGYAIEVADNDKFVTPVYSNYSLPIQTRAQSVSLPSTDRTYYWRIGAIRANGQGIQWSASQVFRVDVP